MRYLIKTKDTEINTSENRLPQWIAYLKKRKIDFVVVPFEKYEKKPSIEMPVLDTMFHIGFYLVEFSPAVDYLALRDICCFCYDYETSDIVLKVLCSLYPDNVYKIIYRE